MSSETQKLGALLKEVSNMSWDEFVLMEKGNQYSSNEGVVFALVRACAMQKLDAIKLSLNRLDGKLKTPIKIETPKIYYLFPYAKSAGGRKPKQLAAPKELVVPKIEEEVPKTKAQLKEELMALSLRQTLTRMSDYPKELAEGIVDLARTTEQWLLGNADEPSEIPAVKSVIAANLIVMAQRRDIEAITEVMDQIDGKLTETIKLIGEDIHITSYALEAPAEARLNADGVLQIEATAVQNLWAAKLAKGAVSDGS